MRELNIIEMDIVSGGLTDTERLEGVVWGFMDGAITGVAIGGKVSGSGSFITGAINQLVSAVIGLVGGAFVGAVGGFMVGRDGIAERCVNYRAKFGPGGQGFANT